MYISLLMDGRRTARLASQATSRGKCFRFHLHSYHDHPPRKKKNILVTER